jgi:D-lyxose ketol-isomerase
MLLQTLYKQKGTLMDRRNWITNTLGGVAGLTTLLGGAAAYAQVGNPGRGQNNQNRVLGGRRQQTLTKYDNSRFYKADGSFNEEAAKAAYAEMFRFHRYSLADVVNDERFWILDFGLGDFANVGMAGIFWLNDKEHGYFGHEIYLLPGQMIPEHSHVPAEGKPAKHEYWQVRNGSIFNFGEGGSKDDVPDSVQLPKSQLDANAITAFKCVELKAVTGAGKGEAGLNRLEAFHFMMGGPEGTIVTEYASYHSGEGLRFKNPKAFAGNTPARK